MCTLSKSKNSTNSLYSEMSCKPKSKGMGCFRTKVILLKEKDTNLDMIISCEELDGPTVSITLLTPFKHFPGVRAHQTRRFRQADR